MSEAMTEAFLDRVEIVPFEHQGHVTGYLLLSGNEVHILPKKEFRGRACSRKGIRPVVDRLLAQRGYLTTRIPLDTPAKNRTGERLGFTWTWRDDRFDYYILARNPFLKGN
ncbi:MAG: hypothetical protein LBT97_12980 [Planctomycetota bacterium]|nr:hypothetical protein [Planctomycetota bacterium]